MKHLIEDYVTAIEQAYKNDKFWGSNSDQRSFEIEWGRKFAKINIISWGQKSVHCFVEMATGDIYKAATFRAPAKGVRGNIKNEKRPYLGQDYYINK